MWLSLSSKYTTNILNIRVQCNDDCNSRENFSPVCGKKYHTILDIFIYHVVITDIYQKYRIIRSFFIQDSQVREDTYRSNFAFFTKKMRSKIQYLLCLIQKFYCFNNEKLVFQSELTKISIVSKCRCDWSFSHRLRPFIRKYCIVELSRRIIPLRFPCLYIFFMFMYRVLYFPPCQRRKIRLPCLFISISRRCDTEFSPFLCFTK